MSANREWMVHPGRRMVGHNPCIDVGPGGKTLAVVLGTFEAEEPTQEDVALAMELVHRWNVYEDMEGALLKALPFVEDALSAQEFKPGAVLKIVKQIRAALAKAGIP